METRKLLPADLETLDSFLREHADSSVLLRSNARRVGLSYAGNPYEATWVGAFEHGRLVGVVAHAWNGNLLLQAPRALESLIPATVSASSRPVQGLIGPWAQTQAALGVLGVQAATLRLGKREVLYAVALQALRAPPVVGVVRAPLDEELPVLEGFQRDFGVEALREEPHAALRSAREIVRRHAASGNLFVLMVAGQAVASCAFTARLPEVVQLGGVWTVPAQRSRGYARAVVAGALELARAQGVGRAVLFTGDDNIAAHRAYEAIGFGRVGEYGLIFF